MEIMSHRKYMVHPGFMTSKNDGQEHHISARRLMQLYKVHPNECVVCHGCQRNPRMMACGTAFGDRMGKYIHLTPRYNGDYELDR
jgi:hypothetical protein